MRLYWVTHLVFVTLSLSACGKTDVAAYARGSAQAGEAGGAACAAPAPEVYDPTLPYTTLEERVARASGGTLYCDNKDNCHPAVAMISVVTGQAIERCSGFLIAPDLIVTNDHCLNHSVAARAKGNDCRNRIFAHFADAGRGSQAQSVSCQSIVTRSCQTGLGSRDYAVLRLSRPVTDRKPLRIAQRGFADGETATILRVQMRDNRTHDGDQGVISCKAAYRTMVYPSLQSDRSPLMTFGDCPIQKGNSGSAALNSAGEVTAIIQGYLTPPEDPKLRDQLSSLLLDPNYGEVGLGTQLACAPELSRVAGACTPIPQMFTRYPRLYASGYAGDFDPRLLPPAGAQERWKPLAAPSAEQRLFIRTPVCVSAAGATGSFQSSIAGFQRGINRSLQAEWRQVVRPGERTVVFNGTGPTPTVNGTYVFTNPEYGSVEVPACASTRIVTR